MKRTRQRGAALVIALVMLAMILLLGSGAASLLVLDEHAARNHRAHQQALLHAQAALDAACDEIALGARVTPAAFPEQGCRADTEGAGLCGPGLRKPEWTLPLLLGDEPGAARYGRFGAHGAALPARYLIERIDAGRDGAAPLYRISATGFGHGGAPAGLQQVVRRQTDAAGTPRCRRLAWRPLPLHKLDQQ